MLISRTVQRINFSFLRHRSTLNTQISPIVINSQVFIEIHWFNGIRKCNPIVVAFVKTNYKAVVNRAFIVEVFRGKQLYNHFVGSSSSASVYSCKIPWSFVGLGETYLGSNTSYLYLCGLARL